MKGRASARPFFIGRPAQEATAEPSDTHPPRMLRPLALQSNDRQLIPDDKARGTIQVSYSSRYRDRNAAANSLAPDFVTSRSIAAFVAASSADTTLFRCATGLSK